MDHPTDNPYDAPLRRHKEYEDPHYHDADEVESGDEPGPQKKALPGKRTPPPRRIPPVRRRFED